MSRYVARNTVTGHFHSVGVRDVEREVDAVQYTALKYAEEFCASNPGYEICSVGTTLLEAQTLLVAVSGIDESGTIALRSYLTVSKSGRWPHAKEIIASASEQLKLTDVAILSICPVPEEFYKDV